MKRRRRSLWSRRRRERHLLPANSCRSSCDVGGRRFIALKKKKRRCALFPSNLFFDLLLTPRAQLNTSTVKRAAKDEFGWIDQECMFVLQVNWVDGWKKVGSSKVFFFFISCPEEKSYCFDMSGKTVCCFIHPLGTIWTAAVWVLTL